MEANVGLGELQQKIKRLEGLCQVSELNINNYFSLLNYYMCRFLFVIYLFTSQTNFTSPVPTCVFLQELRKTESTLRTERDQWRDQAAANKHEVEKLRGTVFFYLSSMGTVAQSCQ